MPSPPAPPSLPPPSLSLRSFVKSLSKFDILQDFHLPDDQFASLKLHKLHQVAVETGVEPFFSPSYCTRRSVRRYALSPSSSDVATPLPVPWGSMPTVWSSASTAEVKHTSTPSVEDPNTATAHDATELSEQEETEGPRAESSTESVSADRGFAADRDDGCREGGAGLTDGPAEFHPEENQGLTNHTGPSTDTDTGSVLSKESPAKETKKCSEPKASPGIDGKNQRSSLHHSIQSQLLLSPLVSALLTTTQLPSSSLTSSPPLPSLGVTPQSGPAARPLTSSPSAPNLILPPPHSPSTQALSPPLLSPCPSLPPSRVQVSRQLVHTTGPADEPHVSSAQSEGSEGTAGLKTQEAEEDLTSRTHTLKVTDFTCCSPKADLIIFVRVCVRRLHLVAVWWMRAAFLELRVVCVWQQLGSGLCASGLKFQLLIGTCHTPGPLMR